LSYKCLSIFNFLEGQLQHVQTEEIQCFKNKKCRKNISPR